jgi:3-hydroxybutyryl-CoA dehydrogenase
MPLVRRLAVVGSGTMGHGIGQLAAMRGIAVAVADVDDASLERAQSQVRTSLERFVKKGTLSADDAAAVTGRIRWTTKLDEAAEAADVVVEAVPESLELKRSIFAQLEDVTSPDVVLASNTSELSITAISAGLARPERAIGMHFFNPPVIMKLVEIVRGLATADEVVERAIAFSAQLGKESVTCLRDAPGFITTRAIMALRLECIRMWEEGIATMEDLDKAMRLGFNHPMGQFELNDFNGLDIALQGAHSLREAYGERFAPPPSLVARVNAGRLGRKTGAGWYDYSDQQ